MNKRCQQNVNAWYYYISNTSGVKYFSNVAASNYSNVSSTDGIVPHCCSCPLPSTQCHFLNTNCWYFRQYHFYLLVATCVQVEHRVGSRECEQHRGKLASGECTEKLSLPMALVCVCLYSLLPLYLYDHDYCY